VSQLPSVSVVVVNLNGRHLLGECLDALAAQDYPSDRVETILVDNGSSDDSVAFVRDAYPAVRIVEAGHNLGFAGGNNLGARIASGECLALINNDARADRQWLRAMAQVLDSEPKVACVGAKILDQAGETIDFVGTAMNLYGRAFQIDEALPTAPGFHDQVRELLAPCGGAMMVRRELFLEVGGFDEDYVAYYEDVDLGWRLWIYGHKVLFAPQAVVYHRKHQTGEGFPVEQRYALAEANALRTLIKNCEDENLGQVLPFSLFMGVKRSVEQSGLDRSRYRLGHPRTGKAQAGLFQTEPGMTRVAASYLVAIDRVAEEMPALLEKRKQVQAGRVRSDQEIFGRFPMRPGNPIFPWRRYHVVQQTLAADLDVPERLRPQHGSRLLIVTHETIGPKMAGPGIRAWEMACALSERFEVMLATPGEAARQHPGVRLVSYKTDDPHYPSLAPYLTNADVVLAMGPLFTLIPQLRDLGKPSIVDLYDPFELEKLARSDAMDEPTQRQMDVQSILGLQMESTAGDFYLCASERQRDFWLGVLLAAGRVNAVTYGQDPTLRNLIDVVPFGIPTEPPRQQQARLKGVHPGIAPGDKLLLWNGGLWQWFDPLTLLDALALVLDSRDDVKLYFAAGAHFDPGTVPEMPIYEQTVARCRELGLLDRHVFFGDWVPYDERGDYLLEADLGVSVHQLTLESRMASRTRLLDCIWAGLPILSTAGDPLSDMAAHRGLGRSVPPGRPDLLAGAILEMLSEENLRQRVEVQAREVRSELTWAHCVQPVAAFLERVAFAPDALAASRRSAETRQISAYIDSLKQDKQDTQQRMQARIDALQAQIEAIFRGRVMRVVRAINVALGRE
jgi:GT2 family glycosyltransferase/glycosyltransferase involved in cell wall biosynthesis